MKWLGILSLSWVFVVSAKAEELKFFNELLYINDGIEVLEQVSIAGNEVLVIVYPQKEDTAVFLDWRTVKLENKDRTLLINLLKKYGVLSWENDYQDEWCHGGYASLSVVISDKSNYSLGACSYPPNYKKFLESMYAAINEILSEELLKGDKYFQSR
ncbi:hypothetical protein ACNKU7_11385 [Microbulbifer sp. SA54]|uniref:hypothetical protein n=1 Tax=Microbulbifer sp. SA54 TaxID=3401577 RepID=UPI003AAFE9A3